MFQRWIPLLALAWSTAAYAQAAPKPQGAALLQQGEPIAFGVFYYPEQWPRAQWKRDMDGMAKLGFNFTHLAEFAWTFIEADEGRFDFAWLDEAIDLADKAGLRVIRGTPSAAPPSWMGDRYPDVYRVDERGQRHEHGIRAEVSLSNPRYQMFVDRLVTQMALRYGKDRRVWVGRSTTSPAPSPTSARMRGGRSSSGSGSGTARSVR